MQGSEIDEVSPDEDDRVAESLVRNHWYEGTYLDIHHLTFLLHSIL